MRGHAKALQIMQLGSKAIFNVSAVISAANIINAGVKGDIPGVGKGSADIAVGTISLIGGPLGWVSGAAYFAIDTTVGIDAAAGPLTNGMCYISGNC